VLNLLKVKMQICVQRRRPNAFKL